MVSCYISEKKFKALTMVEKAKPLRKNTKIMTNLQNPSPRGPRTASGCASTGIDWSVSNCIFIYLWIKYVSPLVQKPNCYVSFVVVAIRGTEKNNNCKKSSGPPLARVSLHADRSHSPHFHHALPPDVAAHWSGRAVPHSLVSYFVYQLIDIIITFSN